MNIRLMLSLIPKIEAYNKNKKWSRIAGLSLSQIELLENYYYPSKNKKFPLALREMLYLFGYSSVFDSGCDFYFNDPETKDLEVLLKSQNKPCLTDNQKQFCINNRPIWIFNVDPTTCCTEEFSFVYLDEIDENPYVWRFVLTPFRGQLFVQNGKYRRNEDLYVEKIRLVEFVNELIHERRIFSE